MVKTKNRYYEMRSTLTHLHFDVVKYEPHPIHNGDSKVYLSKRLGRQHPALAHRVPWRAISGSEPTAGPLSRKKNPRPASPEDPA